MNKHTLKLIVLFALVTLLSIPVFASLGEGYERVFDYSSLFTPDEADALQSKIDSLRNDYGMDVLILTSDESYADDSIGYADDFFDYNDFGTGEELDGFVFFIDMQNRVPTISTHGLMIRYITDYRLEVLLDVGHDALVEGRYGDAAMITLDTLEGYLMEGIPDNQHNIDENGNVDYYYEEAGHNWTLIIAIAIIAGVIAALIFRNVNTSSYSLKGSTYKFDINKNTEAEITSKSDTYIRTSVTKTPKAPPPDSDSGGSSTHSSSSGETHGGGSGSGF